MCLYPRIVQNKKYTPNKKNGGVAPAYTDNRTLSIPAGCGKCIECKKQKARNWQVRLHEEIKHDHTGKYITFTFSEEELQKLSYQVNKDHYEINKKIHKKTGYELDNAIATLATRRFLERWRKKYKKSVKHWFVTELGHTGTERLHIHGIIWTKIDKKEINNIWKYGYTRIYDHTNKGYVNPKTINYIIKYVNKVDFQHKEYNSIILCSAGIGKNYLERWDAKNNKYNGEKTIETYKTPQGIKLNLPSYYRNKIYSDYEREELWIQKLNKNERWICGEKINTEHSMQDYFQLLQHYRNKNKRLGYGDNSKNWSRKQYENELRDLKHGTLEHINKNELLIKFIQPEEAFDCEIPF